LDKKMKTLLSLLLVSALTSCTYAPSRYVDKSVTYGRTWGVEHQCTKVYDVQPMSNTYYIKKVVRSTPFVSVGNPYGTSGSYGGGYYPIY
jgi:hypothetical protein